MGNTGIIGVRVPPCHWMASCGEAASESSLDSSGLASSTSGSTSAWSVLSILDQLKSPQPSEIEAFMHLLLAYRSTLRPND